MKSKELKVYNLPYDRKIEASIDAKPYELIFIIVVVGVILSILLKVTFSGIALVLLGVFGLSFLPKHVLLEFSNEYVVIYNRANHNECVMVYYEDIQSWRYIKGNSFDELELTLINGSKESVEAFSKITFEGAMNKYIPDKKAKSNKK